MTPTDTTDTKQPTHDEIAKRAYEIFQERGGNEGDGLDEDDWQRAEAELRQQQQQP